MDHKIQDTLNNLAIIKPLNIANYIIALQTSYLKL